MFADPHLSRHLELDARLIAAVSRLRLLSTISWPAALQESFLADWRRGRVSMPRPEYPRLAFPDVHAELDAIHDAADPDFPLGIYLRRAVEGWRDSVLLLESLGDSGVCAASRRLFGAPGDPLPGTAQSNLDAARHFIAIADDLVPDLAAAEALEWIEAEALRDELQATLDRFFVDQPIRVELDPGLIAKAAAGASRIRLRAGARFTGYDRHQLLQHEAFVHSLTALNGRLQPRLTSLSRTAPHCVTTQEGLAVFAELITGAIDIARLKRISLRILAIDLALSGADFVEVFRFFLEAGQSDADSFASAQRVFRGCRTGGGNAFTKDTVYLHGLISVHTFFRWMLRHRRTELAPRLFAGKLALRDLFVLEPLFDDGTIAPAHYLPPWVRQPRGIAANLAFSLFAGGIHVDEVEAVDWLTGAHGD